MRIIKIRDAIPTKNGTSNTIERRHRARSGTPLISDANASWSGQQDRRGRTASLHLRSDNIIYIICLLNVHRTDVTSELFRQPAAHIRPLVTFCGAILSARFVHIAEFIMRI